MATRVAYLESEIQSVRSNLSDWSSCMKTFIHTGEAGYRVKH
ncbi:hypothetical protein [Paenibacillus silvisoli]|nr:hypothetical protein [Paenibacillus silvisoli]